MVYCNDLGLRNAFMAHNHTMQDNKMFGVWDGDGGMKNWHRPRDDWRRDDWRGDD